MQSSHKTTSVKQAQRTLLCAYSSIHFPPTFPLKLTIPKFFQNYLWHMGKRKKKLFLGELWEETEWGEKKASTHPIFHNSYLIFSDFFISVAGVGPIPQQGKEKGCRSPAQVPQAQGGPASAHPAQTAGQDTHLNSHLWRTWLNVSANSWAGRN